MANDDLLAVALHLRERLTAHASGDIEHERDAVELVGLADELASLIRQSRELQMEKLRRVASLANKLAHILGQYFGGMYAAEDFRTLAIDLARAQRGALNEAGFGVGEDGRLIEPGGE